MSVEQRAPGNLEPDAYSGIAPRAGSDQTMQGRWRSASVFAAIEEDLRARMAVPVESPNRILLHACCPDNPGDGRESQSRDEDRHLQPRHWPNVAHSTSIVGLGRTSIGPKVLASRRRLLGHFVTLRDAVPVESQ